MSIKIIGANSILCAPLICHQKTLGILQIESKSKNYEFSKADLDLFTGIASQVALLIYNSELLDVLKKAKERVEFENKNLKKQQKVYSSFSDIIGTSLKITETLEFVKKVSNSPYSILITGESGTGKEVMAKSIHYNSSRSGQPFVVLNCAAIPGDGNRKDIRNAVEAAHAAHLSEPGWAMRHGFNRSQILYFIAENLDMRDAEFVKRLVEMTGRSPKSAQAEVDTAVGRLFTYAAYADKFGGTIQETTLRGKTVAVNEPVGVIGIACPEEYPLLGFVSLMAPAIARGNTVVMIPSERFPLSATDFYQVLDTSDVPGGVVNIVTGECRGWNWSGMRRRSTAPRPKM